MAILCIEYLTYFSHFGIFIAVTEESEREKTIKMQFFDIFFVQSIAQFKI